MKKKKNLILLIVINILIVMINFFIILKYSNKAFINNYLSSDIKKWLIYSLGIALALITDLGINALAVFMANKREHEKRFKYYKIIIVPTILTVVFILMGIPW